MKRKPSGFTLIELAVLLCFLGVIAAVTIPKFNKKLTQSREGRTKASLGDLRGALAIYFSDHAGKFPSDEGTGETRLVKALVPAYLKQIPSVELPHLHSKALNTIHNRVDDGGDWVYSAEKGFVSVNCTHVDTKGTSISNW